MTIPQTKQIINLLQHKGVVFEPGLSDAEVIAIEEKFAIRFPPDLKRFLQCGLPVGESFYNWRKGLTDETIALAIVYMLNWPFEDIYYDVRNHNYWVPDWGNQPAYPEECVAIARQYCSTYPKLIPIYAHRFISSEPHVSGNPVFSMYGMDIIYYGYDLATYFAHEFYFKLNSSFEQPAKPLREIVFWSSCVG